MHCDTTELLAHDLALPGVNACANVNAQLLDRVHNCPSATNRARRSLKRRQETVTRSVDFAAAMLYELITNNRVMLSEKIFPSSITEFDKALRSIDNVREQYTGECPVTLSFNFTALPG
jgi:hypothetical protein